MFEKATIDALLALTEQAGKAILPFWKTELTINSKQDESPVTAADIAAHQIIAKGLQQLTPDIPVLSEEDTDISLAEREQWQRWWLVDPLDGTKEFIAQSDEFTVNIALIERGEVKLGIVGVPAQGVLYYGGYGFGAWMIRGDEIEALRVCATQTPLRVLASRRHSGPQQEQLLAQLRNVTDVELVNAGSSLKFCWLAQGKADLYPRLALTSQWDTAAAQAVLEGAGGEVLVTTGQRLTYPARDSFLNPFFIALGQDAQLKGQVLAAID